jgi:hypothetical protein
VVASPVLGVDAVAGADADVDAAPDAGVDAAPGADVDAAPAADADAAPGVDVDAAPGADADAAPGVDVDAAPGVGVDAAPGADVDVAPDAGVDVAGGGSAGVPFPDLEKSQCPDLSSEFRCQRLLRSYPRACSAWRVKKMPLHSARPSPARCRDELSFAVARDCFGVHEGRFGHSRRRSLAS